MTVPSQLLNLGTAYQGIAPLAQLALNMPSAQGMQPVQQNPYSTWTQAPPTPAQTYAPQIQTVNSPFTTNGTQTVIGAAPSYSSVNRTGPMGGSGTPSGGVNGPAAGMTAPSQGAALGDPNNTFGQVAFGLLNAVNPLAPALTTLGTLANVANGDDPSDAAPPSLASAFGKALGFWGPTPNATNNANAFGEVAGNGGQAGIGESGIGGVDSGTASGSNVGGGAANGSGGGGGGGGGKVLCNELHRQGLLSTELLTHDERYGEMVRCYFPSVYLGYRLWADSVVTLMRRSPRFTKLIAPFIRGWATEMKRRALNDAGSFWQSYLCSMGEFFCAGLFHITNLFGLYPESKINALLKDFPELRDKAVFHGK